MDYEEFYAERVANFDKERKIFHEYSSKILPDKQEKHTLDWETRRLEDEATNNKIEYDNLNSELEQIKLEISLAKDEVEQLNKSKAKRVDQIQRLLDLPQPVQQDTTYEIPERFPPRRRNEAKVAADRTTKKVQPLKHAVRTGEVVRLEGLVDSETVKATSYIQDLLAGIQEAEEERFRKKVGNKDELNAIVVEANVLLSSVEKYEFHCFMAVTELLKLRVNILIAQREEVEELERLEHEKKFFTIKEERTKQQLVQDMELMMNRIRTEQEDNNKDFQRQLAALDTRINHLRGQERLLMNKESENNIEEQKLIEILQVTKDRYVKLKRRIALEMEGFNNEAKLLRQRLKQVEKLYVVQQQAQNPLPLKKEKKLSPRKLLVCDK